MGITQTKERLLTPKNLVLLGLYEETFDLYTEFCEIAADYNNTHGIPYASKINHLYKKRFNEYFSKHFRFFSEKNFFINDIMLKHFDILTVKKALTYCFISFSNFLDQLEDLIEKILLNRNNQLGVNAKFNDEIIEELYGNFNRAIQLSLSGSLYGESVKYDLSAESKPIYVYTHLFNLTCNQQKHSIKPKTISVKALNSDMTCNLSVNYCENCDKYFIGITSLSIFEKEYGIILAKFKSCDIDVSSDSAFEKYKSESELHICGYNVIEGKLSIADRRDLLIYFIDNSIMTKFAIRRDLEKAISIFKNRANYINAIKAWTDDLTFVDKHGENSVVGNGYIKK